MSLRCARCFASDLKIVGCYVYSPQGVSATGVEKDFHPGDLLTDNAFVSQKLYLCTQCNAHMPEAELLKAEELIGMAVCWQTNYHGKNIPLVCPKCKNNRQFVRDALIIREESVPVEINDGMITAEVGMYEVTDDLRERIPLRYRCARLDCEGVVTINEDTFKVQPL